MVGKKDDDSNDHRNSSSLYDKSFILQETRVFNDAPLNPRKSRLLLGKVMALLYTGESLTRPEATDLFFATTKLFQAKDPGLRQFIYLVIKELAIMADDVLMVTSSLTKDINAKPDELFSSNNVLSSAASAFGFRFGSSSSSSSSSTMNSLNSASLSLGAGMGPGAIVGTNVSHRADAIRALCRVTEPSMLAAIERFLKQAIVDNHAAVCSSALLSAYHLSGVTKDIIRRWANEVQEAFTSPKLANPNAHNYSSTCYIVQYHALGLLYQIRQHDRMAVAKLVQSLARSGSVRSQWAQCLLIRFSVKCCEDESNSYGGKCMVSTDGSISSSMYEFLKALCNNNDMVMLEAARALCSMVTQDASTSLTATQIQPAIQALQQLLASPKPTLKFSALRTLNTLAQVNPSVVSTCNLDIEALVGDSNRSIATFAITTLLKTGNESSVDRLMKQISGFMSEISDEFKVIIIDAIRVLAVKFPAKQGIMLQFLSGVLREEGGFDYKKSIVEAIFDLVHRMPECLESALAHLCEFIEDCEFTKLAVRILHLLGVEGPKTKDPARYLRYIYNRVILENSNVRAAAVTALASFGAHVDSVRPTVRVLLSRCIDDPDDEVRDRATLYLRVIDSENLRKKYLLNSTALAIPALYTKLGYYTSQAQYTIPLDLATIPRVDRREEYVREAQARPQSPSRQAIMHPSRQLSPSSSTSPTSQATGVTSVNSTNTMPMNAAAILGTIPELAPLVPTVFKSSAIVLLTDKEMEYVVHVVKHICTEWIVFEYVVTNTVSDALLEQVTVNMTPDIPIDNVMRQMLVVPAPKIVSGGEPSRIFVAFQRAPASAPIVSFSATLKYVVKDCDPVTHEPDSNEGFDDEYRLEDVDLSLADYILPSAVPDFASAWDQYSAELTQTFRVPSTLTAAVTNIITLLGMQSLEGSGNVPKDRVSHTLIMSGIFIGGYPVLVRVRLAVDPSGQSTAMELVVRSSVSEVAQLVIQAVQG